MDEIKIRGLHKEEIMKLDRMAKEKKLNRNKYLLAVLRNHLISGEHRIIEERYQELANKFADIAEYNLKSQTEFGNEIRRTLSELKEEILKLEAMV